MILETRRLHIRPFKADDLTAAHRLLERCFGADGINLAERGRWLEWSALSQEWLARMHQMPYGDLAVTLKDRGILIGSVGLVALVDTYGQIPGLGDGREGGLATPEVGLFWAVDPDCQRKGYASEAAQALIDFAFGELRLARLLATTEYDNHASQAVMRRLGMRILRNPYSQPEHLQVVGVLENERVGSRD